MSLVASGSESSGPEPPRSVPVSMTASPPGSDLAVWTDQSANRCILHLRGQLCAETVAVLDRHVDRLGCRWCDEVVVDLRGLILMDVVGASLLVGLGHYVRGRGGRFEICGASEEAGALIRAAEAELEG